MESSNNSSIVPTDQGARATFIIYITGETLIAALAAVGNGLVIAAVLMHSELQTTTNYFVASLASVDFLVGVLGIPCAIISFVGLRQNYVSCVTVNLMIIVLTQISVFGLLAVAIERFIAIKYPYVYNQSCTAKFCLVTVVVVWVAGVLVAVLPLFIWDKSASYGQMCAFTAVIDMEHVVYVSFLLGMLLPLVIMFAIYCYIFHVVKQHLARIAAVQQMAAESNQNKTFKRDTKAAKWFAVVILLFAISWLPLHLMNTVTLYGGPFCLPCLLVAIILSHANSAINPILYAYANTKFKIAFKRMIRIKLADSLEDDVTQSTQNH